MSSFYHERFIIWPIGLLLGPVVLLLSACQTAANPTPTPEIVALHLKWYHQAQFAGLYIAAEQGFYAEENIDIHLIPGGPESPSIPAVVEEQAQFGVTSADDLIKARAAGTPIVALAAIFQESPVAYVAMAESGIERPEDFVGRRVGLAYGSGTEIPYFVMMANLDIDRSRIEEVPVAFDLSPFYTGDIDVLPTFVINEPDTIRRAGYDINVFLAADYGVNIYSDVLFTTEAMLDRRPDLVERFVRASVRGWVYTTEHPPEALEAVMKYEPDSDREHQQAMLDAAIPLVIPGGIPVGAMNREKWQENHDLLLQYEVIDRPLDVETLYTLDFLDPWP